MRLAVDDGCQIGQLGRLAGVENQRLQRFHGQEETRLQHAIDAQRSQPACQGRAVPDGRP